MMFDSHLHDRRQLFKAISALVLALLAVLVEKAFAETTAQLTFNPDQCVALNEGQVCYQAVSVSWQSTTSSSYCLYDAQESTPLVCWDNATQGQAKLSFESTDAKTYRLRLMAAPNKPAATAAQAQILVTWVYSKTKRRRNSWRLF